MEAVRYRGVHYAVVPVGMRAGLHFDACKRVRDIPAFGWGDAVREGASRLVVISSYEVVDAV